LEEAWNTTILKIGSMTPKSESKTSKKENTRIEIRNHPLFKMMVVEGSKYRTLSSRKNELRIKWEAPKLKELKSYIPGTVIKVAVKAGDRVEPGDLLMIYEAMKMQNKVFCPFPGVIKDINIKEGDRVPKGFVLAVYE